MLIIIEGCDGVGKTTLANALADSIPQVDDSVEVLHYGQPTRHPLDEYELDLIDYVPGARHTVIADRYHLGELVYAPLYRETSPLGGFDGVGRSHVELFLAARGAVVVHVDGNERDVRERLEVRGEDYLELNDISFVLQEFQKAAATSLCRVIRVPMTWDMTDVNRILLAAADEEAKAKNSYVKGYVGTLRPKTVMVSTNAGEKVAFMPHRGTMGEYVIATIGWRKTATTGFCNIEDNGVRALVTQYQPNIVAVGSLTSKFLTHQKIAHGAVVQPRTFLHDDVAKIMGYQAFPRSIRDAEAGRKFTWTP